ncbi:hypothetical protein [Roseibium sp.]|uniref:hypothetical protein n=1 Tax=Roseibium sp. TaxID=1936156 RepID=UPI003B51EFAF
MATAKTKLKTSVGVGAMTRVELMQDSAERFIQLADRNPFGMRYQLEKLDVLFGMKLIREVWLSVYADDERIAGLRMKFDWNTNRAMLEKHGEDVSEDKIDQYGTLESTTDTMVVLRKYIDELFDRCGASHISCNCFVRPERVKELGEDRYYEIMGYKKPGEPARKPTQAEIEKHRKDRAAEEAARKAKGTKRVMILPELPEVSIEAW